jgi:hypothetical protein
MSYVNENVDHVHLFSSESNSTIHIFYSVPRIMDSKNSSLSKALQARNNHSINKKAQIESFVTTQRRFTRDYASQGSRETSCWDRAGTLERPPDLETVIQKSQHSVPQVLGSPILKPRNDHCLTAEAFQASRHKETSKEAKEDIPKIGIIAKKAEEADDAGHLPSKISRPMRERKNSKETAFATIEGAKATRMPKRRREHSDGEMEESKSY